jgi:hypothetical protein
MSLILSVMLVSMAPTQATSTTEEEKKSELDQVVCKRFPPPVGTRLGARKVCATKREWAIQELDQDSAMDKFQNRTSYQE